MTMMSQSVKENSGLEMTQPAQQSIVDVSEPAATAADQRPRTTAQMEEQQRQELEVKINELRARCRLQAEQLMAWRKAYAFEVNFHITGLILAIVLLRLSCRIPRASDRPTDRPADHHPPHHPVECECCCSDYTLTGCPELLSGANLICTRNEGVRGKERGRKGDNRYSGCVAFHIY